MTRSFEYKGNIIQDGGWKKGASPVEELEVMIKDDPTPSSYSFSTEEYDELYARLGPAPELKKKHLEKFFDVILDYFKVDSTTSELDIDKYFGIDTYNESKEVLRNKIARKLVEIAG